MTQEVASGQSVGVFAEVDGLGFVLVGVRAYVVKLGYGGEAVLLERDAAVGVEEVGLVLVEEIF